MSHHRGSDEMTSPFTREMLEQLEAEQAADYAEIEQAARIDELIGDFLATCHRRGFALDQVYRAMGFEPDLASAHPPAGYLTIEQTAERLAVKVQTLRVWACREKGPPRTVIARRALYRREALEAWIRAREQDFEEAADD
jgi:hypothetical protein